MSESLTEFISDLSLKSKSKQYALFVFYKILQQVLGDMLHLKITFYCDDVIRHYLDLNTAIERYTLFGVFTKDERNETFSAGKLR